MKEVFEEYGNLALVFYKRAKDQKLLEDKLFKDLQSNIVCLRFSYKLELNKFIEQLLTKVLDALETFE